MQAIKPFFGMLLYFNLTTTKLELDNAMEKSEEGQTLELLSTPETKSTKPESAQNETVPETNEVPTLELKANVEAFLAISTALGRSRLVL